MKGDWDYLVGVCLLTAGVGLFVLSVFALWVLP